jgi:RND family efflux transporter MFP subunit
MTRIHSSSRLVAAALLVLPLAACGRDGTAADAKAENAPTVLTVGPENVAIVQRGLLSSGPAISGALTPEREATIRAETGGSLVQTYVDQGSRVSKGQLLGRIDASAIEDQYLSARSAVTAAQSSADNAKRELERTERLFSAGAIAQRDLDQARNANTAAQSQLADAKARLANAAKQLAYTKIEAPFSGIVSLRSASAGDVVSPGTALFTVVDPTSMRFEASVPADQLSQARVGAPVSFTVNGYPGRTFTGKVSRVSPTADPATGQVRITVAVPNPASGLVGGLFADGRIASQAHEALTVPYTAVDVRGVRPWVLRVKGGKAERQDVQLGLRDEATERVEITSGVQTGDTLLLGTAQGITPGTPVRVSAPSDRPESEGTPLPTAPPPAPAPKSPTKS